jgi:hypothetical protein
MHLMVYLSSASYLFSDEELMDILTKSRLNNSRLGITGLLLYCDGSILQILEGEKEILITLYNTISRDIRHKGVIKMIDKNITERSYSNWAMGFKRISNNDWSKLNGYFNLNNKGKFDELTSTGNSQVITMINSFANVNMLEKRRF